MRSSRAFKKSSTNSTFSARVNAQISFHQSEHSKKIKTYHKMAEENSHVDKGIYSQQSLSSLIRLLRQEAPSFDMDASSENVAQSTDNFNVKEYDATEEIDERENQYIEQSFQCLSTLRNQEQQQESTRTSISQQYDVECFVSEMQNFPCLWNTSSRSHHNQNMRRNAWEELSKKFDKPGEILLVFLF